MRLENHRPNILNPASAIASAATIRAYLVTTSGRPGITPSSTSDRNKSGVATTKIASIITVKIKIDRNFLYGRAKLNILFSVPAFNFWCLTD